MTERMKMKINSKDFRVRPGEKVKLRERPTMVKPFCKSKKRYQKLLGEHVEELSSLQRARRTCKLAGLGPVAEIEPDLAEWNHGAYEGQYTADILQAQPDWNLFRDGCPRGETPAQISDRADHFIARLRVLDGNVALFSHGHFGRVLAARWIGLPVSEAQCFLLDTASLGVLDYGHNHVESPVIALWNSS
jgi:probable phosphoglycerate mutase